MKAITICQPHAHWIFHLDRFNNELKRTENRRWPHAYRGPLLIHAGKSREWFDGYHEEEFTGLAWGAIIGLVDMVACVEYARPSVEYMWIHEHTHARGLWCHVYANPLAFPEPIPWKGQQGIFEVPDDAAMAAIERAVLAQKEVMPHEHLRRG